MSQTLKTAIAVIGIDIGKNSFHIVGLGAFSLVVELSKLARSTWPLPSLPDPHSTPTITRALKMRSPR
jgi:hypothetical protein